jgi:hypothetical protein
METRGKTKSAIQRTSCNPSVPSVPLQTHWQSTIDSIFHTICLSNSSTLQSLLCHATRTTSRPLGSRQPYKVTIRLRIQLWSIAWLVRAGPAFPPA